MSRKLETTHLQVKSVKNASSLGTDEDGNVIAGVEPKVDDSVIPRKGRAVIFIRESDLDRNGNYSLHDANLEDTLLIVEGEKWLDRILFNTNTIKSIGSTVEIVNTSFSLYNPIEVLFSDSKTLNYQDNNSPKVAGGKVLKVTKIMLDNNRDYVFH
ncbi:hypothetical protein AUW17_08235 [Tenacibaculum dicentrarchi]|nr:hypothetical protein AUW17_08235 [Tenacibaculum dicentrarchi]